MTSKIRYAHYKGVTIGCFSVFHELSPLFRLLRVIVKFSSFSSKFSKPSGSKNFLDFMLIKFWGL